MLEGKVRGREVCGLLLDARGDRPVVLVLVRVAARVDSSQTRLIPRNKALRDHSNARLLRGLLGTAHQVFPVLGLESVAIMGVERSRRRFLLISLDDASLLLDHELFRLIASALRVGSLVH